MVKVLDEPGWRLHDDVVTDPSLVNLLHEARRSLDAELLAALEDRGVSGLSPGHAGALLLVDRSGTRLTELAQRAGVTKQAMMQVVDALESAALVRRVADPVDARAKIVRLTARGLRQRAAARKVAGLVETRARRRLGDRRYETLRGALEDLSAVEA